MTSVQIRYTQSGDTQEEATGTQRQSNADKNAQNYHKLKEQARFLPKSLSWEQGSADTLISDFWLQEPWESTFLLF